MAGAVAGAVAGTDTPESTFGADGVVSVSIARSGLAIDTWALPLRPKIRTQPSTVLSAPRTIGLVAGHEDLQHAAPASHRGFVFVTSNHGAPQREYPAKYAAPL